MRDTYGITHLQGEGRPPPLHPRHRRRPRPARALRRRRSSCTSTATAAGRRRSRLRAMKEMADLGLTLRRGALPGRRRARPPWLVKQLDVPFIADESVATPAEVTREVLAGSATAISIKTARTGFTPVRRVHHLAEGLGLEVVMGNQIDGQLGTALHHRVRRGLRAHLAARRRTVQLPRHDRRPAGRAAADPRRRACVPARAGPRRRASTPTSSPATAPTAEPRLAGLEERFTLAVQSCSSQNLSSSPCSS